MKGRVPPAGARAAARTLPPLFRGVRRAIVSARDIELAQRTFNEEGLYRAIETYAREWYANSRRPARVLEFCSASGICARRVVEAIPVERLTLVDVNLAALRLAVRALRPLPAETVGMDAVLFRREQPYDLVLLNSAYHHIDNSRKRAFMRNVARHLARRGRVLVGDHFLRPYRGSREFRDAVVGFYSILIADLTSRGEHRRAIEIIRQAAYQCWCGVTEFKVDWRRFTQDVERAGLRVARMKRVWQPLGAPQADAPIGSIAIMLTARWP